MKRYVFRRLETTEEISSHGDRHDVTNWERIVVTMTDAVSVKIVPKEHTWGGRELVFRRPIWRSDSGELFIQEMAELGTTFFLSASGGLVSGVPIGTPCRINGELLASYSYDEYYYSEPDPALDKSLTSK